MNEEADFVLRFFDFCDKVLEGNYGPLLQISGIIVFVVIFSFYALYL